MLNDQSVAYSSRFVTDNIAARTVKGLGIHGALVHLNSVTHPIMLHFAQNGSKLKQANFSKLARNILEKLRSNPMMLDVRCECLVKAPSPRESYRIRFVIRDNHQGDAFITLMVGEVLLTRREVTVRLNDTHIRINTHVLARYMQREKRSTDRFFEDLMNPLRLVPVMAIQSAKVSDNIAIPMGSGLLFGKVHTITDPEGTGVQLKVSDRFHPQVETYNGESFVDGRAQCGHD